MEIMFAAAGLRITYLQNPQTLNEQQQSAIQETLRTAEMESLGRDRAPAGFLLQTADPLIIAHDRDSNQALGILGVSRLDELCLLLTTAQIAPAAHGRRILDRMVAFALLCAARDGPAPSVIAIHGASQDWQLRLYQLSRRFTGAVFFPAPDQPAISLESARLARDIARKIARGRHFQSIDPMLTILDLRGQSEETILAEARKIYRARYVSRDKPNPGTSGGGRLPAQVVTLRR